MSPCRSDDKVRAPAHAGAVVSNRPEGAKVGTPFPLLPMVVIALSLVTGAYSLCNLFPYVGYMVQHLGVADDKDEAGFYAGYVASAYMVGRSLGSYFWGRVADRFGRLPVVYMSLCSIASLSIAFGLSTTFVWAVSCRFLLEAMNGLIGTSKTLITEVCGREHEVVGMSFVTGCWSVGLVLGSGFGGLLAEPANQYPTVFSESGLLGRFPYLLPNVVGSSLALSCLPLVFFFLEETMDVQKRGDRSGFEPLSTHEADLCSAEAPVDESGVGMPYRYNAFDTKPTSGGGEGATEGSGSTTNHVPVGESGGYSSVNFQARADERLPFAQQRATSTSGGQDLKGGELRSVHAGGDDTRGGRRRIAFLKECLLPMKLLEEQRVRTVMFVYVLFSLLNIGFYEAYPLWAISSLGSGGLDWSVQEVGQALAACGGAMLIFQLFLYPRIAKRISPTITQRCACCVAVPVFFAYPFLPQFHDSGGNHMAASLALLFFTNACANTVFINASLAINNSVDPSKRGTLNGLSVMLVSLATATGPTTFSTIFAWSINRRRPFPFDSHLIFVLLALGMVAITVTSWNVVFSRVETKPIGSAASPILVAEEVAQGVEDNSLSSGE